MDLLKSHKRRSRLGEIAYVVLNVGLALALFVIVLAVQSPWLAFALVLLSKFRALMVRPRFWFANLIANMPDIIVGLSTVNLLYAAAGYIWLQAGIAFLYSVWLLFIKPRSRKSFVAMQGGVAVFVGLTTLSIVSFSWDSVFFIAAAWIIGYSAVRHVLGSYDEPMTNIYSMIMGLIFAELSWISYHWLIAYKIPGFGDVKLSQLAVFATLLCLVAERAYVSYHHYGHVRRQDMVPPSILAVSLVVILLVFFSALSLTGGSI